MGPSIDEMFDTIWGKQYLTMLDCTGAFHGLKLSLDTAKKSAFITHLGKFKWKVAPFRSALLPSHYSKGIQDTLSGLEDFARNYMDEVIISSFTETEHLEHIRQVFQRFREHKMKLKLANCEFLRDKIQFLGHIIDESIRTIPEKTEEISKIKSPANVDEAKAFLGVPNYYHQFIPAFTDLMHPIQKQLKKNVKFSWTAECENTFNLAKKRLSQDPMLYHPDPGKPWIIEMDASKTALTGILLQPHNIGGTTQEVPVTFFSYNLTGTQQSWSTTKRELYAIYVAVQKLHYLIYGGRITIITDHKPLVDIMSGTAKTQNSAAAEKLRRWTYDITLLGPTIEYKKRSSNIIADSLSRLRTNNYYTCDKPLHNGKPIRLQNKMEIKEINAVQTHAQTAGWENDTARLPELQVRVQDIFKVSDKRQLIRNANDILESLNPAKLRELQDSDPSIMNLQRNRKASIKADKNNILRYAVDIKGETIQAILLPKALRPWIVASTHEFSGHQGDQRSYNKIRGTFFWNGMKNDICQAIANCKVCKMESPNLGRYMNLHLEIGTAPMHFTSTIPVRIHTN